MKFVKVFIWFKENATFILAILTGFYVFLTWSIVKQSKKQSDIMLQSSKHIQRAYLHIDIDDFYAETGPFRIKTILEEIEKLKHPPIKSLSGKIKFKLYNEGQTPAFPIFWETVVVPHSLKEYNPHDSLTRCESFTYKPGIKLPAVIVQNHNYAWHKTFRNVSTDDQGHIYVHVYFLYKDVFGDYHDLYAVFEYVIDVNRGSAFGFPPFVDIDTFTEDEFEAILSKMMRGGQGS